MKKLLYISILCLLIGATSSCEKDELEGCGPADSEMKAIQLDDKQETPSVYQKGRIKTDPNPRENGDSGVNDDGDDESGNAPPVKTK